MRWARLDIPDVIAFEPQVFEDARGCFFESFNAREFASAVGFVPAFVQDNVSQSRKGVLRGLHYQIRQPQGKLVRVTVGEVFDVTVDLRRRSPTFGQWTSIRLSAEDKRSLWVPPGFAHGYLALTEQAETHYKTTDYWAPEHERSLLWSDRDLSVAWPLSCDPVMSDKDRQGVAFRDAEVYLEL